MPFKYDIAPGGRVIRLSMDGQVTAEDIAGILAALEADDRVHAGMHILADLRDVRGVTVTASFVRLLARNRGRPRYLGDGSRTALLCGSDLIFGLARMYELARMNPSDEFVVFRDTSRAEGWVREGEMAPVERAS